MMSDVDRQIYYESLGFGSHQIAQLEHMRLNSPARQVGKGALVNTTVDFNSRLNGASREMESFTVEALHALELEVVTDAIEYFAQVPATGIERRINEKRYVHSATLDKRVHFPKQITLVECKNESSLNKLHQRKPTEWLKVGDQWTCVPYENWARAHGCHFEVWSPPVPSSLYLCNLMLLYALKQVLLMPGEIRAAQTLERRLEDGPLTVAEAVADICGLTPRTISILLASNRVFGTLKSRPLDNFDQFTLFADKARCIAVDRQLLAKLNASMSQPEVDSPTLIASTKDYKTGADRLARVMRMLKGDEPTTRRFRKLVESVLSCQRSGTNPLTVCLTRYRNCGRYKKDEPQLGLLQLEGMEHAAKDFWDTGAVTFKKDLQKHVETACETRSTTAPCRATVSAFLKNRKEHPHILATGGRRMLHALEDPSDPAYATIPALAPGLLMHIDSTKFDDRMRPELISELPFLCPTLYVAVDSCTSDPLGRVLMFGDACRDMLAILMRDILHRKGWLPRFVMHDGGSDNTSIWFKGFCFATGMSRVKPPTGDPKKNGRVENALGRVNLQLSQRLLGSTAPDKKGRSVDNKMKSYHTACLLFKDVVRELDKYLFDDFSNTPTGNEVGSPREKAEYWGEAFGTLGILMPYDDNFRLMTSVPLSRDIRADGTKGYRHLGRTYRSARVSELLRVGYASEKLRDPVDPTRMVLKFGDEWVSASSRDSVVMRTRSELDQLFATMMGRQIRSENAEIRERIAGARLDRIEQANASAAATEHLPQPKAADSTPADDEEIFEGDLGTFKPFKVEKI
jgi:putative transposase